MAYLPIFVDIEGRDCLVIGGGRIALRKVKVLLDFDAAVRCIAPEFSDEMTELARLNDKVTLEIREHTTEDLEGAYMVIAATDDKEVNAAISSYCRAHRILVNAVDDKENCGFIFSSYLKEKNLVAAFSSSGNSPLLTQYLRDREREILTPEMGQLNEVLGAMRDEVMEKYGSEAQRSAVYRAVLEEWLAGQEVR